MAGEQSPGTGTPTGGNATGTPAEGATPVGGSPAGAPGGSNTPPAAQSRVIPEDVLPEQLRGRSPQEVRFILNQMATGITQMRSELDELKRSTPPARLAEPEDERPYEERILEEPEKVIEEVVKKLYGPTVQHISSSLEDVTESVSAKDFDDWNEVKDDVYQVLREAGAPKTKQNINQAYELVVGRRTLQQRRINAAAALNPDIPVDNGTASPKLPELHGLEREIFEASGLSREEWEKYGNAEQVFSEIKVPTGKEA